MALTAREWLLLPEDEQQRRKMNYLLMNVSYCGLTWSIYIFQKRKRKIFHLRKRAFLHPKERTEEEKEEFNQKCKEIFKRLSEEAKNKL